MSSFRIYILDAYQRAVSRYPKQLWILVAGSFIQALGWGLVFPFFTLYFRQQLGISMTSVGILLSIFSVGNIAGQLISGVLTDRFGRRPVILVTTFMHPLLMLAMIPGRSFVYFAVVGFVLGLFDEAFSPAANAMIADLVEEPDRLGAYSALRIARNLGVVFGPAVGGYVASISYAYLWAGAAIFLVAFFFIALFFLDETFGGVTTVERGGYGVVLADRLFIRFLVISTLVFVFVNQMALTLPVYLKEYAGLGERVYGSLFSVNAAMVVLLQLPVARLVTPLAPGRALAMGSLLYGIGLGMYAFTRSFAWALVAMVVLTLGEIVMSPVLSSYVAALAPEEHRGKYMSAFGLSFSGVAALIAPPLGGALYELNGAFVWYAAFLFLVIAAGAYLKLPPARVHSMDEVERRETEKRHSRRAGL